MRVLRGVENEDIAGLHNAYQAAQDDILAAVQRAFPGETWTLQEMEGQRAQALLAQINGRLRGLAGEVTDELEAALTTQLKGAMAWTTYALDQATPPTIKPQLPILPEEAIRALVNSPFQGAMFSQRIGIITDEMADGIKSELLQSMIQGEGMADAALRLTDLIGATTDELTDEGYTYRALRIARTEIMRAQNTGRASTYEKNGDLMEDSPEWVATADDRLCEWCLRRDGMSLDEIEQGDGGEDPWGNSTDLPLHPNCRCTIVPRLKTWRDLGIDMPEEYDDDERAMRDPDDGTWKFVPKETYDEWKDTRAGELAALRIGEGDGVPF